MVKFVACLFPWEEGPGFESHKNYENVYKFNNLSECVAPLVVGVETKTVNQIYHWSRPSISRYIYLIYEIKSVKWIDAQVVKMSINAST